jgi:transglutaminase-like putative cysteine protease
VPCQAGAMSTVAPPTEQTLTRRVGCALEATLGAPTEIVLSVAVARSDGLELDESLVVTLDGRSTPVRETEGPCGTRWHTAALPAGELAVRYEATARGRATPAAVRDAERILAVRPSRYIQSDELAGPLVDAERVRALAALEPAARVAAARALTRELLTYTPGSTVPTDGLPEILETGQGVCRDFAHLLAGLLRATDLPARVVSVYAPALQPMDFHAAVETVVDDRWVVVDATGLAPRAGMLRIATGRDAADTAFLANDGSSLTLHRLHVHAEADAPLDEHDAALVALG